MKRARASGRRIRCARARSTASSVWTARSDSRAPRSRGTVQRSTTSGSSAGAVTISDERTRPPDGLADRLTIMRTYVRMIVCAHLPRFELVISAGGPDALSGRPLALAPPLGRDLRLGEVSGAAEASGVRSGMPLGEGLA